MTAEWSTMDFLRLGLVTYHDTDVRASTFGATFSWIRSGSERSGMPLLAMASVTLLFGALLCADPASAQVVASGKSLTVTTANAVATFNGPDLVGFVNSLTNETYLKNPSAGELAQVDTIASTGQALQSSNWTIGSEPGTGLPLATITSSDSVRTFTLTVKIDPASQEIVLRCGASVSTAGLRGASWSIAGLDFTSGRLIIPANGGRIFDRAHPDIGTSMEYPNNWHAQMAVYESALGSFVMYSTDAQMFFKRLRLSSRGDSTVDVAVATEAVAPFPSATTVPAVEWRLKAFAGDWRVSARLYRDWLLANRPPVSNAAHPWVSDIRAVVGVYRTDASLLTPLAALLVPSQTLLYLVDWRQDSYDINYPDYTPRAGVASFVSSAHALGFKVMLHTDLIGVSPGNADYAAMQPYQLRTPETLDLMGWQWDRLSDPQRFAFIDPAAPSFRALWISRMGAAIAAVAPDALHLDISGYTFNDGNGPIAGLTYPQGTDQFRKDIIAAFPSVALGGEGENDISYRYESFAQIDWNAPNNPGHPIATFLFSPQVRYYGYLGQHLAQDPGFKRDLLEYERRAILPQLPIGSASDLDMSNADNARLIGLIQSWQTHAFQPAWTADWTGALVRYEGLAGSTATLTDSGGLTTLTAAGSTLFQLAHDVNQVTSGSFLNAWPAFDNTTLYGLNPTRLYFLDPVPRPGTTHATSLPAGVQIGSGTVTSTSFAHIEVAPASVALFDFIGGLIQAHSGVRFQGVDTPLGNGANASPGTITAGGVTRSGLLLQPPFQSQVGGESFVEYSVPVPTNATMQFSVGVDDGGTCTDGVTFRITANGSELWHQHVNRGGWQDILLNVAAWSGTTVALRLISNPGPAGNPHCDRSLWSQLTLAVPPTESIAVPLALATGSVIAGFDGDGTLSSAVPLSATVSNVRVPGAFTVFTQVGAAVSAGTNLASLPFEVWGSSHGERAIPGGIFGSGSIGTATSGGVSKSQTIWAHPPNGGTTILSWVLQLPVGPLRLGLSVGLGDGGTSADGVDFRIRVNGVPYWQLTTQANQWIPGALDLTRWKGQNVLMELVTDSRVNYNTDWAYWADLVLSTSTVTCSYSVPSSASIGAIGGSLAVNVTATATCPWSTVSNAPWLTISSGSGSGDGTANYVAGPNPDTAIRTGTVTIAGQVLTVTQAGRAGPANLGPTALSFGATKTAASATLTHVTPPQDVTVTFAGAASAWTASADQPWVQITNASGATSGQFTVAIVNANNVIGASTSMSATITVTAPTASNSPVTIPVTLTVSPPGSTAAPFGSFDTPAAGAVQGSIAVTGWALDDIAVDRVEIWRDLAAGETTVPFNAPGHPGHGKVFIATPLFVTGSRPDVEAAFSTQPLAHRAGWGYLLLTWGLWNQGNGPFTLYAFAFDQEGNTVTLGTKTVTADNAGAIKPFGALDTPTYGQTVSGAFWNYGWALTPSPNAVDTRTCAITNGNVFMGIDSGSLTPVNYADLRTDIAGFFPGFSNGAGAGGAYYLDTTTLTNGTHQIGWFVVDNCGRADGIGSRFFTVLNGGSVTVDGPPTGGHDIHQDDQVPATVDRGVRLQPDLQDGVVLRVRRLNGEWTDVPANAAGVHVVEIGQSERVEVQLPVADGATYTGAQMVNSERRALPIGSSLDAEKGIFYWQPAAGFLGRFDLMFASEGGEQTPVRIIVGPPVRMTIDTPQAGVAVDQPFAIAGWAIDLAADEGSGIDTVHVWAYPAAGGEPIFLGVADIGDARPDVAAIYGEQFERSSYSLIAKPLARGTYDVVFYPHRAATGMFDGAQVVRVTVRAGA